MVDILFGESEAACMRYAKTVRTLPAGEGGPDTVLCLAFMLDIGDIQKAIDKLLSAGADLLHVQSGPGWT